MPAPQFIREPILVQARFLPDGTLQPTAFIWRNRTRYVAETGRRWLAEVDGINWECCLVQAPTRETFELHFDRGTGRWMLERAWLAQADA